MTDKIKNTRALLVKTLTEVGSKLDWEHINHQIGLFSFTVSNWFNKS